MKELRIVLDQGTVERYNAHYFKLHPRARKAPIISPVHPSLNIWMIMRRPEMNGLKQKYKDYIVFVAEENGISGIGIDDCDITMHYFFPINRRHDCDNYTPKFFLDGLTEAGVITDDDFLHVHSLRTYGDIDRENPRTEIIITYKTEETNDGND